MTEAVAELLKPFTITKSLEVRWGEMDAAQIVNNATYFKWFETARIHYLEQLSKSAHVLDNDFIPVVGWADCKYIFPVTYPDQIMIGIKIIEVAEDRFFQTCHMVSQQHERLVAIANARIVGFDVRTKQKANLPDSWLQHIKQFEGLA